MDEACLSFIYVYEERERLYCVALHGWCVMVICIRCKVVNMYMQVKFVNVQVNIELRTVCEVCVVVFGVNVTPAFAYCQLYLFILMIFLFEPSSHGLVRPGK